MLMLMNEKDELSIVTDKVYFCMLVISYITINKFTY